MRASARVEGAGRQPAPRVRAASQPQGCGPPASPNTPPPLPPPRRRLILSGTPIQNSVLELWSLFDFLMPGFLGPERDFNAKYGKALQVRA
jgi:hypothetical protein